MENKFIPGETLIYQGRDKLVGPLKRGDLVQFKEYTGYQNDPIAFGMVVLYNKSGRRFPLSLFVITREMNNFKKFSKVRDEKIDRILGI